MKTNIPDTQISWHEKRLMQQLFSQQKEVASVYSTFVRESSQYIKKYSRTTKRGGVWRRNSKIEAQIDKLLINLHADLTKTIDAGTESCIALSKNKFDNMLERYIKDMSLSTVAKKGIFEGNVPALKSFLKDKSKGLELSGRIWKITKEAKTQVELFLESGIPVGRSAAEISRDLRSNLKDPDKRFRRIKDPETGKYKLSKPMADFHPGIGRYRSSYKNALRLTGTATNRAYRLSDNVRWNQRNFVLGYLVELSDAHPKYDICDSMVGEYPKTFVFTGWHPNCICNAVPILPDPSDFAAYLKEDTSLRSRFVKKMPPAAQSYFDEHIGQYETWKQVPWWVTDNFEQKGGVWRKRARF
jgi:hypothetical protein